MIYFIQDNDLVKIGFSSNPKARLHGLRTANWRNLKIIAVMPGDQKFERKLHEHFAQHRFHREWFVLCEEIAEYIEENAKPFLDRPVKIGNYSQRVQEVKNKEYSNRCTWLYIIFCYLMVTYPLIPAIYLMDASCGYNCSYLFWDAFIGSFQNSILFGILGILSVLSLAFMILSMISYESPNWRPFERSVNRYRRIMSLKQ